MQKFCCCEGKDEKFSDGRDVIRNEYQLIKLTIIFSSTHRYVTTTKKVIDKVHGSDV